MGNWITCKWSDIPEDNEPYKMVGHSLHKTKKNPWLLRCRWCGLVAMKNRFSLWALRVGCENRKHPQYKQEWVASGK